MLTHPRTHSYALPARHRAAGSLHRFTLQARVNSNVVTID